MSHTITDKSKLTVVQVDGDLATIDASIQTALRGSDFANGDKIIDISILRNKHNNKVVAYITFEDQ
tara:strand:+ start:446 stop:643 length:198 start_codon:yes stop_codon:yes gene_type:complete